MLDFPANRAMLSSAVKHIDLFSGIGSWALAARHVWGDEYKCVGFCDNDYFCQQVLTKNFPGVPIYDDIRTLTNTASEGLEGRNGQESPLAVYRGSTDLITASTPCQPASSAGRRRGKADDRWLWPQALDVIRIVQPTWCILENVYGLLSLEHGLVFEELCLGLESIGYSIQTYIIPAVAVGAPHRRDRVWIIAHTTRYEAGPRRSAARDQGGPTVPDRSERLRQLDGQESASWPDPTAWQRDWREVAASTCATSLDDGTAGSLVRLSDGSTISRSKWRREALKAVGNAICPQVAIEIMQAIKAAV